MDKERVSRNLDRLVEFVDLSIDRHVSSMKEDIRLKIINSILATFGSDLELAHVTRCCLNTSKKELDVKECEHYRYKIRKLKGDTDEALIAWCQINNRPCQDCDGCDYRTKTN